MSPRKQKFYICCGLVAIVAVIVGMQFVLHAMHDAPYQMIVLPESGGAVVQFIQPSEELVSPRFHVRQSVDSPKSVVLDSPNVQLPVGELEFADHTFLPGRFTIRIDNKRFDVMQNRIDVDNTIIDWQPH